MGRPPSYPKELRERAVRMDRDHLEAAVLDWVDWFNTERPHEAIDDLTPIAAEELHYRYRASLAEAG